jgi:hypothetical protein
MKRREFIAGLGSTVAWPTVVGAQSALPIVGFLSPGNDSRRWAELAQVFSRPLWYVAKSLMTFEVCVSPSPALPRARGVTSEAWRSLCALFAHVVHTHTASIAT